MLYYSQTRLLSANKFSSRPIFRNLIPTKRVYGKLSDNAARQNARLLVRRVWRAKPIFLTHIVESSLPLYVDTATVPAQFCQMNDLSRHSARPVFSFTCERLA